MVIKTKPLRQKRILIIRNAYSYDFGGGERFPVLLAEQLENNGFETIVVSRSNKLLAFALTKNIRSVKGWWWRHQDFSGIKILLAPVYLIWQIKLFFYYLVLIMRLRPSIVHPQSRDDFIAATLSAKFLHKRVVWTDHADLKYIWQNHSVWYKNPVGKLVYLASKFADHITMVSHNEKRHIEEVLQRKLPNKFVVIHNGVSDQDITPIKRSAADKDSTIFIATSRLVHAKGIGDLIDAYHLLDKKLSTRLWLVGEGPEKEKFRAAAKDPRISFLGFKNNALGYVAAADVFVHPSHHEGFSISLVEAAMLGKPIIACDIGGNPEIVTSSLNGILVHPKNSKELAAAMTKLSSDRLLRDAYGKTAREVYKENFVFENIVKEKLLPLYE